MAPALPGKQGKSSPWIARIDIFSSSFPMVRVPFALYTHFMPDMKEYIARTALEILKKGSPKKLTVTDIVEACNITRQTFYYHFSDIPEMFEWILSKKLDAVFMMASKNDIEEGIRIFFLASANSVQYIRKGVSSGYGEELERNLSNAVYAMFDRIVEKYGFYPDCTRRDLAVIRRYHCQAVMGLFREWTDNDMENLDYIVHIVYQILTGKIRI